jgi:hypothetical protein
MTCRPEEGCPTETSDMYKETHLCVDNVCTRTDLFHLNMIDTQLLGSYTSGTVQHLVRCAHGCRATTDYGMDIYVGHRDVCVSEDRATDNCGFLAGCELCYDDYSAIGMHDNQIRWEEGP